MKSALTYGLAACLAFGSLAGCENIHQQARLNQADQLERALLQCKEDLGFKGQTRTAVEFNGTKTTARVIPHDQIDAQAAAKITTCAGGTTTLNDGMVVVPMTAMSPTAQRRIPAPVTRNGCPAGATGMYRGTLYCTGGAI